MVSWYINRIKTFSLSEIPYRIKQLLQKKIEKRNYLTQKHLKKLDYQNSKPDVFEFDQFINNNSLQNTNLSIFGERFDFTDLGRINWHQDIFTKKNFPKVFSKEINILKNPQLSAKAVWEINRHQFLMKEVLNYNKTRDIYYLNRFIGILKDWIQDNPYLIGINWYSNIEVNIRLINWFLFWEILKIEELIKSHKEVKDFVENFWIPSIYEHCNYSYNNPSLYSSANNHLISEYSGLFVASSKWNFKESISWNEYAKNGLEKEIQKQHSKNGVNKEEAAEYIQFITDFFLIAFVVGERTENLFSKKYEINLKNIFTYIYDFLDLNFNFPKYGDEDDGWCFRLDFDKNFNNFQSLLTSGAIIFEDPKFKSKSNGIDLKNELLFGKKGIKRFDSLPKKHLLEVSKFYQEEGHFYFKKQDQNKEIYLHFDTAPLGFLSIAAHGHADALSVLLHVDGDPILVDPGTFTYHTEKDWRNYFLSTIAHNTICIDNQNQATQGGPTLWLKHYKTKVRHVETGDTTDVVLASHNGYERMNCTHEREVIFEKNKDRFIITDYIQIKKSNREIIQPWHLHPDIEFDRIDSHTYLLRNKQGKRKIKIKLDKQLEFAVICGQEDPIIGWYSKSFMEKEKTYVIAGKIKTSGNKNFILKTIIEIT